MNTNGNKKIADRININNIYFETHKKRSSRVQRALVYYSPSQKVLLFNSKMLTLLNINKWESVVVGFDKVSKIIVLKLSEPDEYGSVLVREKPRQGKKLGEEPERESHYIFIGHIVESVGLNGRTTFRAERSGNMIFLERVGGDNGS